MGKIVDTDDVLKSAEYVIALMKSNPDVHVTEEQHEGFKQAFKVVLDMTQAVKNEPEKVEETTRLKEISYVGERLRIRECIKCNNRILTVVGSDDYTFCPICGKKCASGTYRMDI